MLFLLAWPGVSFGQHEPIVYISATLGEAGKHSVGTGFFIGPAEIATCYHVVEGATRIEVFHKGEGKISHDSSNGGVEIAAIAPRYDLAVLRVAGAGDQQPPGILRLRPNGFQEGDKARVYGHPQARSHHSVEAGITTSSYEKSRAFTGREGEKIFAVEDVDLLSITLPGGRGMSGGPVVLQNGAIGVFAGIISPEDVSTFGWAIPVKYLLGRDEDEHFTHYPEGSGSTSVINWPPASMFVEDFAKSLRRPGASDIRPLLTGEGTRPPLGPKFVGRERELRELDQAWDGSELRLVSVLGTGGFGEQDLVRQWVYNRGLDGEEPQDEGVFWFDIRTKNDVDAIFRRSIERLTGELPRPQDLKSSYDKLIALRKAIGSRKCLFVLDGLDILLHTGGGGRVGEAEDPALADLLRWFCRHEFGNSLCVVISRIEPTDVTGYEGRSYLEINLQREDRRYSRDEALEILALEGVTKGDMETRVRLAVQVCDRQDLALRSAASLLREHFDGDASEWHKIGDEVPNLPPMQQIFRAYERLLRERPRERRLMVVVSHFREPVERSWLARLSQDGRGDEGPVANWGMLELVKALDWLIEIRLLRRSEESRFRPDRLIAEYFRDQSEKADGDRIHGGLFDLYRTSIATEEQPDMVAGMRPLYEAVYHGCKSGQHLAALRDVYEPRIVRSDDNREPNSFYNTKVLRDFAGDLEVLSHFFQEPWTETKPGFTDNERLNLIHSAALNLCQLGKLRESLAPFRVALEAKVAVQDWKNACIGAGNLGRTYLQLGDVAQAKAFAERAVDYADRLPTDQGGLIFHYSMRSLLAMVLHMSGRDREARIRFEEAERGQRRDTPEYEYLISLRGFWYCQFLLDQDRIDEALSRSRATHKIHEGKEWTYNVSLDDLNIGRALCLRGGAEADEATSHLNRAVEGLRQEGPVDLSRGLLARAECYRERGLIRLAEADLVEVQSILETTDFKLMEIERQIQQAMLHLEKGELEAAAKLVDSASESAQDAQYKRRTQDLDNLRLMLSEQES